MSPKDRLRRQLVKTRELSEKLLADFHTREEWVHQVHPGCNHALWFAGHMANSDNFFLSLVAPPKSVKLEGFAPRFGMGSHPTSAPDDYPPPEDVLETMRERRQTLLGVLDQLSDDDLARPTPAGSPDFLTDFAAVFEMANWHEAMHAGQLSVTRRALGHQPLSG
ncbi:MAG: DinB family protein [Pirellulaceae bacterium]